MIDKDKIIAMQRNLIEKMSKKVVAMEQEIALLKQENKYQKRGKKRGYI